MARSLTVSTALLSPLALLLNLNLMLFIWRISPNSSSDSPCSIATRMYAKNSSTTVWYSRSPSWVSAMSTVKNVK